MRILPSLMGVAVILSAIVTAARAAEPNIVMQSALRAGIRTCVAPLAAVSDFLISASPHGAFVTQHGTRPETNLFSATLERTDPLGTHLITLAMAPAPGGGCSISYDHVTAWKESCAAVAAGPFKDYQRRGALVQNVLLMEKEPLLHVALLPSAGGCVTLKREVMYFAG